MSYARAYNPTLHFEDDNGHPLAGGWLYTFLAGTNTPVATAANESGSSMNPVNIRLDSRGECEAWLSNSVKYKFVIYSSDFTWSQIRDNVFVPSGGSEYSGDVSNAKVSFDKDEGDTSEISTGSTLKVLFTKISSFFAGLKRVAFTGSYNDLEDTPTIPAAQVQSDWNEANNTKADYIKNKPSLASVATSGNYADLNNKPTIPAEQIQSDWSQTDNTKKDYIKNKPSIPDVSGKLNINGDNATAEGSSAIVDKIAYNDDPTIDDNSEILQKNGNGNWEKISLSGIWEYIKSKFVPVISHGFRRTSKTVVSGEENDVTLSPAIELPTKRAKYAVAIITADLSVDPNGTSLAGVSDKAVIVIDIGGSSIYTWITIFEDGYYRSSTKTTFQFKFVPAVYPSTVTARVYSLNAPVGSIVKCDFHITLLGNDTNF